MLPHKFVEEYLKTLKYSEVCLFLALLHLSSRFSKPDFYQSDEELEKKFGISRKTIQRARPALRRAGLVEYKSGYRLAEWAKATRYIIFPDPDVREKFRIWDESKGPPIKRDHRKPK